MDIVEELKVSGSKGIKEFYKGKDIFITGGLGFIGKVLIEKLLRSCGDLNNIYCLVRGKKDETPQQRLDKTLSDNLFDIIRREFPSRLKKVTAINGDVCLSEFGMSLEDQKMMENVSIIFHSAATVRFDEPLSRSILINTKGTYEIMKLGEKLHNIKAIVHVSTTYCNLDQLFLDEKVYPPYADWKEMINAAEKNDEKVLDAYYDKYHKYNHNTYTLSKHLAEQVVNDYRNKLPVLVYRPAIVTPVHRDPSPGWVDNWNGPVGLCAGIGAGIVRTFYADPRIYSEYTPVDASAKCMIVAAYSIGTKQTKESDIIPVYNCSRAYSNRQITLIGLEVLQKNPLEKTLWAPDSTMTSSSLYFHFRFLMYQMLPALLVDAMLFIFGQKPFLMKLQKKVYKSSRFLAPFLQTQWKVSSKNVEELDRLVPKYEFSEFGFYDDLKFELSSYLKLCITGVKKNLLKEPEQCSEKGIRKVQLMVIADKFIRFLFYALGLYVLLRLLNII